MSSSSPEPEVRPPKKSKGKAKEKKTAKQRVAITPHGKNEAPQTNYEPPKGSVLLDTDSDFGKFDWNTVKIDKDLEVWLIRVPDSIKPNQLENIKMNYSSSSRTARVGQLQKKSTKYDVWSLGEEDTAEDSLIGGEELKGLSCLLPRSRKNGQLYSAPKPVTRHLVLSASAVLPSSEPVDGGNPVTVNQNPPRHSYSKDLFKHRFTPYGSKPIANGGTDVEMVEAEPSSPAKGKKRPRDAEIPKKTKKAKAKP